MFETNKKPANRQKLRGGYYTPPKLAEYLVQWAIRDGTENILEPSAGDGNFVAASLDYCQNGRFNSSALKIIAVELEEEEAAKGEARTENSGKHSVHWFNGDFFAIYPELKENIKFDVVFGNPPFIRFQHFDNDVREVAFDLMRDAGYNPTKLANAWIAFVQLSIELLKEGGRLAMVVPAELLQVKYASELRSRLSKQFKHIVLIGFKKLVFPEIQQEVLLLLAEGKRDSSGEASDIHTIEYEDGDDLISHGRLEEAIAHVHSKHSRNGMKWTSLFLKDRTFKSLDEAEQAEELIPLGNLAEVDIGVVTGRNSFFVLTKDTVKSLSLKDFSIPILGRTSALNSIVYGRSDLSKYSKDNPAYLLHLTGVDEAEFSDSLIAYLQRGKDDGVHLGFKCRIRNRWYDVPSVYTPGGFLFRQINRYPLLVLNKTRATSTDTIHRVRFKKGINGDILAAIFFNSLTLAWAEVCGRSYGGGVLELEPREAEEIPLPYKEDLKIDPKKVDDLLRQNCHEEALDYVDGIVLKDYLGFDKLMVRRIRNAWEELRDRRITRR